METTRELIGKWIKEGQAKGAKWMIVVCDTFSHEDYPVYAHNDKEFWIKHSQYDGVEMQKIMESYDLTENIAYQLSLPRCHLMPVTRAV